MLPPTSHDWLSYAIVLLCGVAAAGAGTGGGGLFVPLLVLTAHFAPHESIPLSKVMIFGLSIPVTVLTLRSAATRSLLDLDMALFVEPMTLAGTVVGVWLNRMLSEATILALLTIVLGFTVYRLFKKVRPVVAVPCGGR